MSQKDKQTESILKYGFRSPVVENECPRVARKDHQAWFHLAEDLNVFGQWLLQEGIARAPGKEIAGPFAFATRLFIRTMSNFQGALILAERGLAGEGLTCVRAIHENTILLAGLKSFPEETLQHLRADDHKNGQQRLKLFAKLVIYYEGDESILSEAQARLAEFEIEKPDGHSDLRKIAENSETTVIYLLFRHLSATAAHASFASLNHHDWIEEGEFKGFSVGPNMDRYPAVVSFASHALLIAISYGIDLLTGEEGHPELQSLYERVHALGPTPGEHIV
jgi:hypothetical protein